MVAVGMTVKPLILSVFKRRLARTLSAPPTDSPRIQSIQIIFESPNLRVLVGFGFEIFHSDFNPCNTGCNPTICGFNELFIVHGALY